MDRPLFYLEYGAEKKSFADWGLEAPKRRLISQASSSFTINQSTAKIDDDPLLAFEATAKIWRDDTIIFQGCRVHAPVDGRPNYEGISYELLDPWYYLETTVFQQARRSYLGNGVFGTLYVSELFLFTKIIVATGELAPQTTKEQITEILNWAITTGANLQIGTIDVDLYVPSYQVREISCAEAIQNCLRMAPDAVTYFDYSTTPPTLHIRRRANLTPKSLPYADGAEHKALRVTPRPELQVPCVALKFKRTHTIDGLTYIDRMDVPPCLQVYPPAFTGAERRALVQTIDLVGITATSVTAKLKTISMDANSGDFATRKNWWKKHHDQLGDTRLTDMIIDPATVLDKNTHAAIDLSIYQYELQSDGGQIAPWMKLKSNGAKVLSVDAVVTAKISYSQSDTDGTPRQKIVKSFSTQVTLTNAPSDTYQSLDSFTTAEPIPDGMAQSIYQALAQLQFDVEYVHNGPEGEVPGVIEMDHTLNIGGGRPEWEGMQALIQTIDEDFEAGETSISCGPVKHLAAGDMTALFMMFRYRFTFQNPDTRSTGKVGSGGQVQLADQANPKQDTGHNVEEFSLHTVAFKDADQKAMLVHNAEARSVVFNVIDAAGNQISGLGAVTINLGDCNGKVLKVVEIPWYDDGCNLFHRMILASDPY